MPAFGDAHAHPLLAGLGQARCWLTDAPASVDAYLDIVRDYAADHPDLPWIIGEGWAQDAFPLGRATADLLDAVVPDRPVFLESSDGHSGWANSLALERAGIGPETPDPRLGHIERSDDGTPMGTLREHAMALVERVLPPTTAAEREAAVLRGQAFLHRLGVGSWQDAEVDADQQAAYMAVAGRGELTARVALALAWDHERGMEQVPELVARRQRVADEAAGSLRAPTVKIFQDGVVENATGAMIEPYLDADGRPGADRGESRFRASALRDLCVALDDAHFAVHAHAIGDRAVREVLDALTTARKVNGPRDSRHQIAHLQFVDAEDLPRFRPLGVIANCQPYWAARGADEPDLTVSRVGEERFERMYPFGSLVRLGATLAFGSDWSVTTPDPLQVLDVATRRVARDLPDARPLGPASERLGIETAMRAYTRGSAHANCLDDETGTIEMGRPADLVLLDGDPLAPTGVTVADARVMLTMVDGRVVWQDPGLEG